MKKVRIGSGLQQEDAKTALLNKNYKRITINQNIVTQKEEIPNATPNKVLPLNYFAGPNFLFIPR